MSPEELREKRQAVVLIHGIGDQRPMDTLRRFVGGVLNDADGTLYASKPDQFSESFELRRLMTESDRPRTDFFEFYWQHRMRDHKIQHVLTWMSTLLWRRKATVPPHLRSLWRLTRIGTAAVVMLLVWAALAWAGWRAAENPAKLSAYASLVPLALSIVVAVIQYYLLGYVGDAARYLSANPDNIDARHAIREAGVKLLERLHWEGKYSRIILVGHSLGSVIGYDILTYAWQRFHERFELVPAHPVLFEGGRELGPFQFRPPLIDPIAPRGTLGVGEGQRVALPATEPCEDVSLDVAEPSTDAAPQGQPSLEAMERLIASWNGRSAADIPEGEKERFRQLQRALWLEYRRRGLPWLVTDFVTLGSPLAHAGLLMAHDSHELGMKQRQRELPCCPPLPDPERHISYKPDGQFKTRPLHHAACFAITKWTNVYFESRWLLFGDFLSGGVQDVFGPGVCDTDAKTTIWEGWLTHTRYWDRRDWAAADSGIDKTRVALDLGCASFDALPAPPLGGAHLTASPGWGSEIWSIK
jgi:hypothetical protein